MSKEDKTVHWNYRVMRYTDGHGDETYGIYAVYYDQQGDITGYSATPSFPIGDTLEELREDFNNMLLAYGKPVIDHKE